MQTFEEIMSETRYRTATRVVKRVGSASVAVSEMTWPQGRFENLPARYSAMTVYRSRAKIGHTIAGEQRPVRQFLPGDVMLRPPNFEYVSEYHAPVDLIVFAIETDLVQKATAAFDADVAHAFGRFEARAFRSPLVSELAKKLADTAETHADRLYADTLTHTMIHELWRMSEEAIDQAEAQPGQLAQDQLKRVDDLIAETPGAQVSLDVLAQTLGMSTTAFSTAVKLTTGMSPYQYVLVRRIARARDLIETTRLSLAEIAYRSGFSSQSHMTDVFTKRVGASPGKLRKGL